MPTSMKVEAVTFGPVRTERDLIVAIAVAGHHEGQNG